MEDKFVSIFVEVPPIVGVAVDFVWNVSEFNALFFAGSGTRERIGIAPAVNGESDCAEVLIRVVRIFKEKARSEKVVISGLWFVSSHRQPNFIVGVAGIIGGDDIAVWFNPSCALDVRLVNINAAIICVEGNERRVGFVAADIDDER